jgi:hypothetical protein
MQQLLADYPQGLVGTNFSMAYAQRFGGVTNFLHNTGFPSLLDFFQAMPDIVRLERMENRGFKLYSASAPSNTSRPKPQPHNESKSSNVEVLLYLQMPLMFCTLRNAGTCIQERSFCCC